MFTINNPVAKTLPDRFINNSVFSIFQLEKGDKGTPHLQGYLVTIPNPKNKNGYTLKWLKDNICPFTHWEHRRGTHEQAVAYCSKTDTRLEGPWQRGEWSDVAGPSKGGSKGGGVNASKIMELKRKIDAGAQDPELYESHFGEMMRYAKGFDRYRMTMKSKFRNWQTKAIVFYGPPGTGKSFAASQTALANFGEDVYYLDLSGETVWWDGYTGQKCVVIEEFYGQMKIGYMLKLLDRYPLQVQTKGSYVPFLADVIFITSNEHPRMWYGKGSAPGEPSKIPIDILNALSRRLESKCGTIKEFADKVVIPDDNDPDVADLLTSMIGATEEYNEILDKADPDADVDDKKVVIDLTSDEVLDDDEYREDDRWDEYREMASANGGDFPSPGEGEESQFELDARTARRLLDEWQDAEPGSPPLSQNPTKLRRTDSSRLEILAPPQGSAADFRKLKQIPGQGKLNLVPVVAGTRPQAADHNKVNDDED